MGGVASAIPHRASLQQGTFLDLATAHPAAKEEIAFAARKWADV
jgi:hypothetical protein